jgi:hypothetical protein
MGHKEFGNLLIRDYMNLCFGCPCSTLQREEQGILTYRQDWYPWAERSRQGLDEEGTSFLTAFHCLLLFLPEWHNSILGFHEIPIFWY